MTTENPLAVAGAGKPKRVGVKKSAEEWCVQFNAHLMEIGRHDFRWQVGGSAAEPRPVPVWVQPPYIAAHPHKAVMDRRGEPMSKEDTDELNRQLEKLEAKVRYDKRGERYDAVTGEPTPRPGV